MHALFDDQISWRQKVHRESQTLILFRQRQINIGDIRTEQTFSAIWSSTLELKHYGTSIPTTSWHLWEWHPFSSSHVHQESHPTLWAGHHQQGKQKLHATRWGICNTAHAMHHHPQRWDHGLQDGWLRDPQVDSGWSDHPDQRPQLPLPGLPSRHRGCWTWNVNDWDLIPLSLSTYSIDYGLMLLPYHTVILISDWVVHGFYIHSYCAVILILDWVAHRFYIQSFCLL